MPFSINPDGTISFIAVEYDSAGRMKIKKKNNTFETPRTGINPYSANRINKRKKRKNKKSTLESDNSTKSSNKQSDVSTDTRSERITPQFEVPTALTAESKKKDRAGRKQKPFLSIESIDTYFKQRKLCNDEVPTAIYKYAERELSGDLWNYFLQCYHEHTEYCQNIGTKAQKDTPSSSALRGASLSSDVVFGKSSGSSRQPRFGYARDIYGRIQERDHLDEERNNEFQQAQRRQSGYDYSGYDAADDHDSYYDSPGYD